MNYLCIKYDFQIFSCVDKTIYAGGEAKSVQSDPGAVVIAAPE